MKTTPLQFTKRELQAAFRSPLLWAALGGAAIVMGLTGPFGTYDALPLPARLGYWGLIALTTYFAAFATVTLLAATFFPERRPSPAIYGLFGVIGGLPAATFVWLTNLWIFGTAQIGFSELLATAAAMAAIASATIALFSHRLAADGDVTAQAPPRRPALMDRLPPERRGRLYHLSMQDHYVDVVTDKGSHLLLMRLSDAIAETEGIEGVQIHRSHWVAADAIARRTRDGDRVGIVLVNGTELPVSRGRLAELRRMGLV